MTSKPNILWIVLDALRADRLGCYGHGDGMSPNIDSLAEQATVYEHALAASCWSLPSYTSMLTGLYPGVHNICTPEARLPDDVPVLPERISGEWGYQTACLTGNAFVSQHFGLHRGFARVDAPRPAPVARPQQGPAKVLSPRWIKGRWRLWRRYTGITDLGGRRLVRAGRAFVNGTPQPWFLMLVLMEVHGPFAPPARWVVRNLRERLQYPLQMRKMSNVYRFISQGPTPEDWDWRWRVYDAALRYDDRLLGRLFDTLKARGMWDDTAIIVTADHGETLGERGRAAHIAIGESLVHVPLIIKAPGQTQGRRVSEVVEQLQLSRQLMEDEQPSFELPGQEFALSQSIYPDGYKKPYDKWLTPLLAEWKAIRTAHLLRTKEWEYIEYSDGERELFDMVNDRAETRNVIEQEPDTVDQLGAKLKGKLAELAEQASAVEADTADLPQDVQQNLRDLGYL